MTARVDALLRPARGDSPWGADLRGTPLYRAIAQARRYDDPTLPRGVWETDLKSADWSGVVTLCCDALEQSKDLCLAAWLTEAWTRIDGFAGAADGFALVGGLCTRYWQHVADGPEAPLQSAALEWLVRHMATALRLVPIVEAAPPREGALTWSDLVQAERLEQLRQADANAARRAEDGGALTRAEFAAAFARSTTDRLAERRREIDAALSAVRAMAEDFETAAVADPPGIDTLVGTLEPASRLLSAELMARTPREVPQAAVPRAVASPLPPPASGPPAPAPLTDRAAAYRQLAEIAAFLNRTEPHSPVPYVLAFVADWGTMTLPQIDAALRTKGSDMLRLIDALGLNGADE
ncbi:type VI secretion system protein TssA [Sphingomonas sp.]|uniref:type VI secretion system protein TssA n=1 Tax=Sphingomonas sp. TaxID=28214 RepID=UPI0028A5E2D0|nr:type VI secretion system protein TssA [Sphingomonas sp.]